MRSAAAAGEERASEAYFWVMAPSGSTVPSRTPRLLRHPWAMLALPLLCLAGLLTFDLLDGPGIRIGGLMVAVPALSAGFLGPGQVLIVVAATLPSVVVADISNHALGVVEFPVSFTTVVLISAASVAAAAARRRRDRELAQARWVAATTQRALLRPLPRRLGPLAISSIYLAADEEATIGGDVYAAAEVQGGIRVMVGDVQGKGLAAVEMAGYLLSAFRRSARLGTGLTGLPDYLDVNLREDLTDSVGADTVDSPESADARRRLTEGFVTAVMAEFEKGDETVRVVNCGHPPPLCVHRDTVRRLDATAPGLPLGLGDLGNGNGNGSVDTFDLAVGDTLLLYTDGVIEARDRSGTFYPLAARLGGWTSYDPGELLQVLRADLLRHVDGRLADDVAVVAVRREG